VLSLRHADSASLKRLEPMLAQLRAMPELREVRPGVFYRRSRAFMHFHDDPSGLHTDIRLGDSFERHRVETADEQAHLIEDIRRALGP